ncbi:MAG: ATP-binding protein [Agriterribacter sp.]
MNTFTPLLPRYVIAISVFCLLACKHKIADNHPVHFNTYFAQLDTVFSENNTRKIIMHSLDSVIQSVPAGEGDLIRYYRYKAVEYMEVKNFEKAFAYVDSVQSIAKARNNEDAFIEVYARALLVKSNCYMILGNYDATMKYLLLSRTEFAKTKPAACKYWVYNERIGDLLYRQQRYKAAIHYYKSALQQIKGCSEDPDITFSTEQRYFDNIGLCYAGAGQQDSAAYFYQTALDYISINEEKFPNRTGYINLARAVIYSNMAKIKRRKNQFTEAESLNLLSIQGTAPFYKTFTLATSFELVDMYMDWGKIKEAEALLNQLKNSEALQDSSSAEGRTSWYLAMEKLMAHQGDTAKALTYNILYLHNRDSLELLQKSSLARDFGRALENKEQSAFNETLEKEGTQKSFQLIIVILLSLLSLITVGFIWYNLWRKAKHVKSLERLNREIQSKNTELLSTYASLEKGQDENARMTLAVAHDLKNSVSRVGSTVNNMLRKQPIDDMRDAMELIKSACSNSITLIEEWMEEKAEQDDSKMTNVDLRMITQYCVNILQTKADEKDQRLSFEGEPVTAFIHRQKIWRVISNLLNNAIKFSPNDAVIYVKLEKKENTILFSVKDSGIGIPPELEDKIFTMQPGASRVGTAGEESHGLGLAICLAIVQEHKGRLWFESEQGKGSTFYVELPMGV